MVRNRLCTLCDSTSQKRATYGYAGQSLRLYCGTCAAAGVTLLAGAVDPGALVHLDEKTRKPRRGRTDGRQCEDCGVKAASFGIPIRIMHDSCSHGDMGQFMGMFMLLVLLIGGCPRPRRCEI